MIWKLSEICILEYLSESFPWISLKVKHQSKKVTVCKWQNLKMLIFNDQMSSHHSEIDKKI